MPETSNHPSVIINDRFRGPPTSGHGGYVSGALADFAKPMSGESAEITLRAPVPFDTPLLVETDSYTPLLQRAIAGNTLIAEVTTKPFTCEVPPPPSWAATRSAAQATAALKPNLNPLLPGQRGFHPICFCCGPEHSDGLQVYVAPVEKQVAGLWQTKAAWADHEGLIPDILLWTALDCPGQYAFFAEGIKTGLLGRMTAQIDKRPAAGETLQVTAWTISITGKKHLAGSAIFDQKQQLVAYAHTLWIGRQPSNSIG